MNYGKFVLAIFVAFYLMYISSVSAAPVFDEEFSAPALESNVWSVISQFRGSYSLAENPGNLRYNLDGQWLAQSGSWAGPLSSGWSPSTTLKRSFEGENWTLEYKATYNLNSHSFGYSTGAQYSVFYLAFDQDNYISLGRGVDWWYDAAINPLGFQYQMSLINGIISNNDTYWTRDASVVGGMENGGWVTGEQYWRITRTGSRVIAELSHDGTNYEMLLDSDFNGFVSNTQSIYIDGAQWEPAGSYVDYDYIRVNSNTVTNQPPIANAGVAQKVTLGTSVMLNGSNSSDPDGDVLTFAWQFMSKPAGSQAVLSGANTTTPSFVPDLAGSYLVKLTVSDPSGATSIGVVNITANTYVAPIAVIAPVTSPVTAPSQIILDGRGSSVADGANITYQWKLILALPSGGSTLANAQTAQPTLKITQAGTYTIALIIGDGRTYSKQATITVKAVSGTIPPPPTSTVSCRLVSGSVMYYTCNGKRITQEANMGTILNDVIANWELLNNDSVATWLFGDGTGPFISTGHDGQFAYYANCTRYPQATPVKISPIVFPPATIKNFTIVGRIVTGSVCSSNGCVPFTYTLPQCP